MADEQQSADACDSDAEGSERAQDTTGLVEEADAEENEGVDEDIDEDASLEDISHAEVADEDEISTLSRPKDGSPTSKKKPRKSSIGGAKKARTPSVVGLTIPFRTVKKAMKLDPATPIVQNEAAIMTTIATELFLKKLAKGAIRNAKNRGRNTVRYEDVAEARTSCKSLSFLEPLLP